MNEKILIKVNWEESGPTRRKNAHKVDEEGIEEDVYKLRDDGVFMKILEEKGWSRVIDLFGWMKWRIWRANVLLLSIILYRESQSEYDESDSKGKPKNASDSWSQSIKFN